jgi:SAM-dependent methyltransferase
MKLDVGCGENKQGDIGVDTRKTRFVDIVADCYYLPFKDEYFDEVSSTVLLEHCLNPFNALREQVRVLRKGGILRCETDFAGYWRFNIFLEYHPSHFKNKRGKYSASDTHYMIFYPENVERMFVLLGLRNVSYDWKKSWKKIDRILRFFHIFKANTYPRFIVKGMK